MKILLVLPLVVLALCGCQKKAEAIGAERTTNVRGHYQGVGLYPAGPMWEQVVQTPSPDPAVAGPADDEYVVVVVNSMTGEIRQCGNISGACVRINPWTAPRNATPAAPALLAKHAAQLAAEQAARNQQAMDEAEQAGRKSAVSAAHKPKP